MPRQPSITEEWSGIGILSEQARVTIVTAVLLEYLDSVSTKHLISVAAPYVHRSPAVRRW